MVRFLCLPADATGLRLDVQPPTWQRSVNCLGADPYFFFPERGGSTREAKGGLPRLVAREDCLEYALENGEEFGIRGGFS